MMRHLLFLVFALSVAACKKDTPENIIPENDSLTMGNPSGATTDPLQPANYLLVKPEFAISYNRDKGTPNWVSWYLSPIWRGLAPRSNAFRSDPALPAGWYQVQDYDYSGSGFDRGHLCPAGDRDVTPAADSATFFMTNMMPQAPNLNRGEWEVFESYCRSLVDLGNELYIVCGGAGSGGIGSASPNVVDLIASGRVTVPAYCWKVAIVMPNGTGDIARVTANTRVIAINMPNTQAASDVPWHTYRVSVDELESLTGFDFFSNIPADIQAVIEAAVDNDPI